MIKKAAEEYQKLMNFEYNIVLGRKGKSYQINLGFDKTNFSHLAGLNKLTDIAIPKSSAVAFDQCLSGHISYDTIQRSKDFGLIAGRIENLAELKEFLENESLIFGYDKNKLAYYTAIEGDFVAKGYTHDTNKKSLLFISRENKNSNLHFCRSFFPLQGRDYTRGQALFTVLYKGKTNILTQETVFLINKLPQQENELIK